MEDAKIYLYAEKGYLTMLASSLAPLGNGSLSVTFEVLNWAHLGGSPQLPEGRNSTRQVVQAWMIFGFLLLLPVSVGPADDNASLPAYVSLSSSPRGLLSQFNRLKCYINFSVSNY